MSLEATHLKKDNVEESGTVVLGNGVCAYKITQNLVDVGETVAVVTPDREISPEFPESVERLPLTQVAGCRGVAGEFTLNMLSAGENLTMKAKRIVIAEEAVRKANFNDYGLKPGNKVMTLSEVKRMTTLPESKSYALLNGLAGESDPVITGEMMQLAHRLKEDGAHVYYFTNNLKVADEGLEALYRRTKDAGVIYHKGTTAETQIAQTSDGGVSIRYTDEIAHTTFSLEPDVVVVDEKITPSDFSKDLGRILDIEFGPDATLQSDNVHRATTATNRQGIFIAGTSRLLQSAKGIDDDALAAVMEVRNSGQSQAEVPATALIDSGKCIRCLTCYRICPYGAITLNTRPAIASSACQGCGICVAECPRKAIGMETLPDLIGSGEPVAADAATPGIIAFCCSRSAAPAGELAAIMGKNLPQNLRIVQVPCAGAVSQDHVLSALRAGADGVLVLTCHPGNCHSTVGNTLAHNRVDQIGAILSTVGFDKERVAYHTLAANMGVEFSETLNEFKRKLQNIKDQRQ